MPVLLIQNLGAVFVSASKTVQELPNSRQVNGGWVTDLANIISNNTETELNRIISELEAKKGTEIAVVTVPKTAPSPTPKAFATELFIPFPKSHATVRRASKM